MINSIEDIHLFHAQIGALMADAGRHGLFKTQHALEEALRTSGFEVAEHLEKIQKVTNSKPKKAQLLINGLPIVADPDAVNGSHRTGSLSDSLSKTDIDKKLGFKNNSGPTGDGKCRYVWGFTVGDKDCAIWDYKGARWSTYGPDEIFEAIFGDDYL